MPIHDMKWLWLSTIDCGQGSARTIRQTISPDILGAGFVDHRLVRIIEPVGICRGSADFDPISAGVVDIELLHPRSDVQNFADKPPFMRIFADDIVADSKIVQVHRRPPIIDAR